MRHRLVALISAESTDAIERPAAHLATGDVVPSVGARHRLGNAADALTDLTAGAVRGKSVVVVRADHHEHDTAPTRHTQGMIS